MIGQALLAVFVVWLFLVRAETPVLILVCSGLALMFSLQIVFTGPAELRVDANGLTILKWRRARSIPWSDIERVELSANTAWTEVDLHLREPLHLGMGDILLLVFVVAPAKGKGRLGIRDDMWEGRDVLAIHSLCEDYLQSIENG